MSDGNGRDAGAAAALADIEVLVAAAEDALAVVTAQLAREGRAPDPSDPLDPAAALGARLAALRGRREKLLRRLGLCQRPRPH